MVLSDKCHYCSGTGKMKVSLNEEQFDRLFDKYADMGHFNMGESYDKAHKEVGYELKTCTTCNGTGQR